MITPFHIAVPVHDLKQCEDFYVNILGCSTGRRADHWVDLNLFGHQYVLHFKQDALEVNQQLQGANQVDGKSVPVPHFGVILTMEDWKLLSKRVKQANIDFVIEPYIRFEGEVGEQGTMFFKDPSGNALEFKGFDDFEQIFAS